ncbi:hypothetical protein ACFFIX_06570 [Metabacillus herbersteinensis]|uniref:Uncharacterized protein n=1 Tax=Metabacillus herbersteinensis TaxID=283816 RepID=A0ABV6GBQ8_9BACI
MKLAMKFNDGIVATIEDFGDMPLIQEGDFLENLKLIKENDGPIDLVESSSGSEDIHKTGKDLVSVEIIFD